MGKIKIATFSLNHGHAKQYLAILKNHHDFEWVATSCAPGYSDRVFLNLLPEIPIYDSDKEMLDAHPEIESVVVASANYLHYEQFKLCAERGIHIFSMKIPTFNMAQYDEIIELTEKKQIICQIELEMRLSATVRRVKELYQAGSIGKLYSIHATNLSHNPCWWLPWQAIPEQSYCSRVLLRNSRTAVMNVDAVKRLLREMAILGYNELQLYTEDTYEVEGEPYFGYLRGRYSRAEIKEIDAYAIMLGIELVPCIQTLAHLRTIYRWNTYYTNAFDCFDVLLIDSPRTHTLIENMFRSISQTFSSKKINVGMDEAFMLGRGKYLDRNGYHQSDELYRSHMQFVKSVAQNYGFKIMLWGDMLKKEHNESIKKGLTPKKIDEVFMPVEWAYGNAYKSASEQIEGGFYSNVVNRIRQWKSITPKIRFCGAAMRFFGYAPSNGFSLKINEKSLDACIETGVPEYMLSFWGDCGCEIPIFSCLPNLMYCAERAFGNTDYKKFTQKFSTLYFDFDLYMQIDKANNLKISGGSDQINNSSKYLLFNDTFLGCMDKTVFPEIADAYLSHITNLKKAKKHAGRYQYLYKTQIALLEALSVKFDLGVKTRAAYQSKDLEQLKNLAEKSYKTAIKKIKAFYNVFKEQWMIVNKPHGFDVTDIRIGALLQRLESNRQRLLSFLRGEIDEIAELQEIILDEFGNGNQIIMQNWGEIATPNVLVEYLPYV